MSVCQYMKENVNGYAALCHNKAVVTVYALEDRDKGGRWVAVGRVCRKHMADAKKHGLRVGERPNCAICKDGKELVLGEKCLMCGLIGHQ